jgi:hypothetical protein
MAQLKLIGLLSITVLLGACVATTAIRSNHDVRYTREPQRVLIITNFGATIDRTDTAFIYTGPVFAKTFLQRLSASVNACGAATQLDVSAAQPDQDVSLQSDADRREVHRQQLKTFKPDSLLSITVTGGNERPPDIEVDPEFDMTLTDLTSDTKVWRANVTFEEVGQGLFFEMEKIKAAKGEKLADAVMAQMKQDGIFRDCH